MLQLLNARALCLVGILLGLLLGLFAGAFGGYTYARSTEAGRVLDQLSEDNEAVEEIKAEAEVIYETITEVKEVIVNVPDTSGCLDAPIVQPDIVDGLFEAYAPD